MGNEADSGAMGVLIDPGLAAGDATLEVEPSPRFTDSD